MEPRVINTEVALYMIRAQEEENNRIASELHEGIAQTLFSVFSGLQFVEKGVEQEEFKKIVQDLIQQTERALEELRRLSTELYPQTLAKLGLISAMKSYLKSYTSTFGIMANIETIGEVVNLSEEVSITLFRVCQETLSNAARYADTNVIKLVFNCGADNLQVLIEDHGLGFDLDQVLASGNHLGLDSMKKRVELIDGTFTIFSEKGKGTTTQITVPL
jgi:signal transduction histidine kinase